MAAARSDAQSLQTAFAQFATGVVVVLARTADGEIIAARARAFNSLSLDPPLVLWSLDKAAPAFEHFRVSSTFAIHILADDQEPMMHSADTRAAPDITGPDWAAHAAVNLPVHGRCSAWFACEHVSYHDAEDHGIFIGEIKDCAFNERRPLVHCAGELLGSPTPA